MTLDEIFNEIMAGSTVELTLSAREYNNLRTSLLRKHRVMCDHAKDLGLAEAFDDSYVQAFQDKNTGAATFKLAPRSASKRPRISYLAKAL